jgi:hypothetical protein
MAPSRRFARPTAPDRDRTGTMGQSFFETVPMPVIYACVVLFILLSCELGFQLGRLYRRREADAEAVTSVGPMVAGLLGMLAFLLGFAFSIASDQHSTRRQNVLDEANVIGTAYLRADLLPPERGAQVRTLLREYVGLRLQAVQSDANMDDALRRSRQLHRQLWTQVSAAALEQRDDVSALAVDSINHLINMHETRFTGGVRARIPMVVWIGLVLITLLTMLTLGLQLGLIGKRRILANALLSLAFGVLITLIVDLNRPQGGLIRVGQGPMIDLQESMQARPPGG